MNTSQLTPVLQDPKKNGLFGGQAAVQSEAPANAHLHIASALQVTLDPDLLLHIFAREVRTIIPCGGITYANAAARIYAADGKNDRHHCSYALSLNGEQLGELHFTRSKRFSEKELAFLENLLQGFLYPIRNALLYVEAQRAAMTDTLTGLKNRAAFDDRFSRDIERAVRYGTPLALIMIDLDNFKTVNDTYGHGMGDRLLQALAQVMQQTVRKADEAFRLGGDEFALMLPSTDLDGAEQVAHRVRGAMQSSQVMLQLHPIHASVSIGVAAFARGENGGALLERADAALYRAKHSGRDRVCAA